MSTSGAPLTKQRTTGLPCRVGHVVERRHELVLGVERHLGDTREACARAVDADAALLGQHDQRALGRVADQRLAVEARVGAQRHRQHDLGRAAIFAPPSCSSSPWVLYPSPVTL